MNEIVYTILKDAYKLDENIILPKSSSVFKLGQFERSFTKNFIKEDIYKLFSYTVDKTEVFEVYIGISNGLYRIVKICSWLGSKLNYSQVFEKKHKEYGQFCYDLIDKLPSKMLYSLLSFLQNLKVKDTSSSNKSLQGNEN